MILRKLMIIIMGIFLVICAGACNIYPLYLKMMSDKFGFTLKEVNLYGAFINMGLWIAFPMGCIYDSLGPKISCIIGALLLSGSYLALHFLFNSSIQSISIIVFLIIAIAMGQGSALCYTTSVATNLKNFRFKESSAIVGLLVANMALSPSVFTTYRQAMKNISTDVYFLIIAGFIFFFISICGFVFRNIRRVYNDDEDKKTYEKYKEKKIILFLIYLNILILIVYSFGVIFHSLWEVNSETTKFPLVIIYPALQLLNFLVVVFEKFGLFDSIYFKPYIDKLIKKLMQRDKHIINIPYPNNHNNQNFENIIKCRINDVASVEEIKNATVDNINNIENKIDQDKQHEINNIDNHEFTEVKLNDLKSNSDSINNQPDLNLSLDSNDKRQVILNKEVYRTAEINTSQNDVNQRNLNLNQHQDDININFSKAILSKNIIILFVILFLGIGSEISNLNNIEFIVISVNKNHQIQISNSTIINSTLNSSNLQMDILPTESTNKSHVIYSYVILYFVFNSFARIISGLLLDHLIKIQKFFYYLVVVTSVGLISQLLGILMDPTALLISISLAGACHGGYMTFIPIFVRNEYGLKHMGKILGFLTSGNALGALLIADGLFIMPYNLNLSSNGECYGTKCFMYSYMITSIFFTINLILSIILLKKHK